MNSQEGKDVGNDRSECNNVNPTQPQQSTSKVSSTVRSYRGYSSFWQQRCHYGKKAEVPATLAKEILMDLSDQWDMCQYSSHIYREDKEVLKHTQGGWISFQSPTGKSH